MDDNECADMCPSSVTAKPGVCCGIFFGVIAIIVFALGWDTVEPTQYGIVKNGITTSVDLSHVFLGGRYCIWVPHAFITFPRHLVNLEFSDYGDRNPIPARTGPDVGDEESGGQPVALSVSFQYQLSRDKIPSVYRHFATAYEVSFLRFAQQAITNEAQNWTPRQFWQSRRLIEMALEKSVNMSLWVHANTTISHLQLLKVDFSDEYERTITQIQLQEQLKVTKTYNYSVNQVLKEVDVLASETQARIRLINAEAARTASVLVNSASAEALRMEQDAKAHWYRELKKALNWTSADFLKYVKIKSLAAQQPDHMVVGVKSVGS